MTRLTPGSKAPRFALEDQYGKKVKLADFEGRKLLLYFYPQADTPGCTRQACSVRDSSADLDALGVASVGISPDTPERQKSFDDKYALKFPLLADTDHTVAERYGAWGEKNHSGKKSMGVVRSAFLIDEQGRIAGAWYDVKPEDTVPRARELLGQG